MTTSPNEPDEPAVQPDQVPGATPTQDLPVDPEGVPRPETEPGA